MKKKFSLDKELIKYKLSQDLEKITKRNFNEKILQEIEISNKKKPVLFDEKPVFKIFILISFFAFAINNGLFIELKELDYIIASIIFCLPVCFLIYNVIYKLTLPNSR